MSTASFVLACAISLLGRSEASLPPIVILEQAPPEASRYAVAFVRRGESSIYIIGSSLLMREAIEDQTDPKRCRQQDSLRLIASIIVHEQWHLEHDSDEVNAYYAQLTELQRLGVGPGRWAYESVVKSLRTVRDAQAKRMRAARAQLAAAR